MKHPTCTIPITIATVIAEAVPLEEESTLSIQEACKEGMLDVVRMILQQGEEIANVDETDDGDWTPLHHAIHGGCLDVVNYLVTEMGANFDVITTTEEGQESLHFACSDGHLDVIKYIAAHGGQHMMNAENDAKMRPLLLACFGGRPALVRYLLEECNVDVDIEDGEQWTALHYAALSGDLETVCYLVEEHHVDCNAVEVDQWSPLHCAANKGHTNVVKYLLEKCNADRDAVIEYVDQTALHLAASEGRLDTVKYLVEEQDFDPTVTSKDNQSAFHLAARFGVLDVVKYFVERLDSADRFDLLFSEIKSAQTAYDIAVRQVERDSHYGDLGVVEYLYSFIAPIAIPGIPVLEDTCDGTCLMLNCNLSDGDMQLAQEALQTVVETEAHPVACHVLGFLCMTDIKS